MEALKVSGLTKKYPTFTLDNVNFTVKKGRIAGLIGRNGAGKSTTLKSIMGIVAPTSGEIEVFGRDFTRNETELKQKLGFVAGGFNYYKQKSLQAMKSAIAPLYRNWREEQYQEYLKAFEIDERKRVRELSEGMKLKFSIALALSHGAELLILDEPTSGLDPVSREEFCDIITDLNRKSGISVLFSTHITSDLEKIADDVVYISNGKVFLEQSLEEVLLSYRLIRFETLDDARNFSHLLIGLKEQKHGYAALIRLEDAGGLATEQCTPDDIMIHLETEKCRSSLAL